MKFTLTQKYNEATRISAREKHSEAVFNNRLSCPRRGTENALGLLSKIFKIHGCHSFSCTYTESEF